MAARLGNVLSVAGPATGTVAGRAIEDSVGGTGAAGEAIRSGLTGREHDAGRGLIQWRGRA